MSDTSNAVDSLQDSKIFRAKCSAAAHELSLRGFKLSRASFDAISKFESKSARARRETLSYLDRFLESLTEFPNLRAEQFREKDHEKVFLQRHLWRTDTRFGDENYLDRIESGDVVEIYTLDGIQIFRSWSCFEVCSYSLSDLLMYEWDVLYERPSSMVKAINDRISEAIANPTRSVAYNVPGYLMFEKFEGHDNKIDFQMKYIFSIVDRKTGAPVALCSTGRAQLWKSPVVSSNLSFM